MAKKKTPKEAAALFQATIKANAKTASKSKDRWVLVDAPANQPIPLTEYLLCIYGFQKIKRNTYLQDGIEIIKEGKKFFYKLPSRKKEHIATVQQMKIIFLDAGKQIPEAIDPSGI